MSAQNALSKQKRETLSTFPEKVAKMSKKPASGYWCFAMAKAETIKNESPEIQVCQPSPGTLHSPYFGGNISSPPNACTR